MEIVTYSKNQIAEEFADCKDLRAMIVRLEEKAATKGQVICKVKVNGMMLNESDEERLGNADLSSVNELQVESAVTDLLIDDTIVELRSHMGKMQNACVDAADIFRSGNMPQAQKYFSQILSANKDITGSLIVIRPFVFAKNSGARESWATAENHNVHTIRELYNAFEQHDYVLVADILEYELYNCFGKWAEILSS